MSLGINELLFFQDEASVQFAPTIIQMWSKKGKQPRILTPGRRKRQQLTGAVDPINGRIYVAFAKTLKAEQYQQFLEGLIAYNPGKKIILYTDNAKAHRSKNLEPFLEANKDKLKLRFLPKYSPDWNPQEVIRKKMRKAVTHNTFFETFKDFQRAIIKFFKEFKLSPYEIISLYRYGKLFGAL